MLFHRRDAESAKKKINLYAIFFTTNAHRACFLLFSAFSTENNTINQLSDLCDANEQSEWAVNKICVHPLNADHVSPLSEDLTG